MNISNEDEAQIKKIDDLQYYAENYSKLCRLCLSQEKLVTIYSNVRGRNVYYIRNFVNFALNLLTIKINKHDGLPNFLCERCERNLNIIANFKRKCDESIRLLERVRDTIVKQDRSEPVGQDRNGSRTRKRRAKGSSKQPKQDNEEILKKLPREINVEKASARLSARKELERSENERENLPATTTPENANEWIKLKDEHRVIEISSKDDEGAKYSEEEGEIEQFSEGEKSDPYLEHFNDTPEQENVTNQPAVRTTRKKPPKEKIVCAVCGVMVNNVKSHMIIHSGRSHQCEQCSKSFTSRNKLQSHINSVHLRKRDFKCEICGKAFLEKNNLKGHMRIHDGDRKYGCDLCPKTFLFAGTLRCHKLTHTQEKQHACQICGKLFLLRTTLNKHLRVHTDEKPHICNLCDRRFRTSTHLTVHMRTHTGEKPLNCRICQMAFSHHKARSVHMKAKHPDELVALGLIDEKGHLKF
ncbi:zinc finger protein 729-like [Anopheles nili]|uniref:zinc finger protein 729-like n=1 Tax=Anopheles nili TaxID=185578 RepID=UPI00237B7057|nr:zinc finger protein 729-like [Anopheles nili]